MATYSSDLSGAWMRMCRARSLLRPIFRSHILQIAPESGALLVYGDVQLRENERLPANLCLLFLLVASMARMREVDDGRMKVKKSRNTRNMNVFHVHEA